MTDPVTRARALLAEATPGPWRAGTVERYHVFVPHPEGLAGPSGERVLLRMNEHFSYDADAALIAAAPTLLAELCDRIEALEAKLEGKNP